MKIRSLFTLLLLSLFFSLSLKAQNKYEGQLFTKLGDTLQGSILVNLNGPNDELIEVSTSILSKTKRGNRQSTETIGNSAKIGVALISYIVVNDNKYYFRDIKYDYNEKYHMNVCVKLLAGTLDCGIFQNGLSNDNDNLSVKLPNNEFSKLVSVDFDYYKATTGWQIMAFGKCASLHKKMSEKLAGYTWDDSNLQDNRIVMWKNWVNEFNECR